MYTIISDPGDEQEHIFVNENEKKCIIKEQELKQKT